MIHIVIPSNLPELVREKFKAAKDAQELTFWPTEVSILHVNSVPVSCLPLAVIMLWLTVITSFSSDTVLVSHKNPSQRRQRVEGNRLIRFFSHLRRFS